jgi:hypothetical protein
MEFPDSGAMVVGMQGRLEDRQARDTRLRRLKATVVATTAGLGMLLWGIVSGTVASTTDPTVTPTPQPVTQDVNDDGAFFGTGGQDQGSSLGQTNVQPMTRTRGS